jgi:hypothetical protein
MHVGVGKSTVQQATTEINDISIGPTKSRQLRPNRGDDPVDHGNLFEPGGTVPKDAAPDEQGIRL